MGFLRFLFLPKRVKDGVGAGNRLGMLRAASVSPLSRHSKAGAEFSDSST
jgi:hypothetical protein